MIDSAFNYGTTPFNTASTNNSHNLQLNNNNNNNNNNNKLDLNQRNSSNNNNNNNNSSNSNNSNNNNSNNSMIIENQTKIPSPLDYKNVLPQSSAMATNNTSASNSTSPTSTAPPPPLPVTNNSLTSSLAYHQHNQSSLYKLNMLSPCRSIQTIHQPHQYPPQPSSTGSASPNSNLSASASPPTVFPSPSYSTTTSSLAQNDLTSTSTGSSAAGYTWNTYAGLSSRPQFPYAQYATDYYGSMTSAGWFSQDRLYPTPWPPAAATTPYGFPNLDDIAFQTQLQRRSIRCTCPNCTNEMSGLPPIVGPDERGRKQHICHIPGCERLYGKASHLKTHLRWHTGERPFLCLTCGKRFSRSDELQRHGRTHTNYRPYSCPICAKKFSRSDHLSKHKKTHFKDKKSKKSTAPTVSGDKETAQVTVKKEIEIVKASARLNDDSVKKNEVQDSIQNSRTSQTQIQLQHSVNVTSHNSVTPEITNTSNFLKQEPTSPHQQHLSQQQHQSINQQSSEIPSGYSPYSVYPPHNLHHPQPTSYTHGLFYNRDQSGSSINNSNNCNTISDEETDSKMGFPSAVNHLHHPFQQGYSSGALSNQPDTNSQPIGSSFGHYDPLHGTPATSNYPSNYPSMAQYHQFNSRTNGVNSSTASSGPTSIPSTTPSLDYSSTYSDFAQNSMMTGYHHHHHHWTNYHHPQIN